MLHAELITFVDQLVWAHLVGYRCDIFVDVLVSTQPGLKHFVLLAVGVASNWFFQAAFPTFQHISDSLFLHLLLHFLVLQLNGLGPSYRFSLGLGYLQLPLLHRVTEEELVAYGLVELRQGLFRSVIVQWPHFEVYRLVHHFLYILLLKYGIDVLKSLSLLLVTANCFDLI